jgi:hypothetical protein
MFVIHDVCFNGSLTGYLLTIDKPGVLAKEYKNHFL